jgi:TolB protein
MRSDGSEVEQLTFDPAPDYGPAFSPDGTRLAFISERAGQPDVWLMTDSGGGFVERDAENLTRDAGAEHNVAWSPDGTSIVYSSDLAGDPDLWTLAPERPARPQRLTSGPLSDFSPSWAPDGTFLVFVRTQPGRGDADLYRVGPDGAAPRMFVATSFNDIGPDFSPYGPAVVFVRDAVSANGEAAGQELMVVGSSGEGARRLTRGMSRAKDPTWARDASP